MLQYYSPCVKKRCRIFEQNDEQCEFGAKKKDVGMERNTKLPPS